MLGEAKNNHSVGMDPILIQKSLPFPMPRWVLAAKRVTAIWAAKLISQEQRRSCKLTIETY